MNHKKSFNTLLFSPFILLLSIQSQADDFKLYNNLNLGEITHNNNTLEFKKNGETYFTGSDLSIDGYTVFQRISGTPNGFILNYIGNNFGANINIIIENINNELTITKTIAENSYNDYHNEGQRIIIHCENSLNIKYKSSDSESIGPLLWPTNDVDFDKYCTKTIMKYTD